MSVTKTLPFRTDVAEAPADGRVRILLVLTSTAGGAGLHTYYLAKGLPSDRFDVTVAFGPGYPFDEKFDALPVRVVRLSASRSLAPLANLRAMVQLYRLMRQHRFHVVCMGQSIGGLIGRLAAVAAGVPRRVFVIHAFASRPDQPWLVRQIYRTIERVVDPLTTQYIAVSHATRQAGIEQGFFSGDRCITIPNGVPDPAGVDVDVQQVRAEVGIAPSAPLVLAAARFETQKGLRYLLDAFARVVNVLPEAKLLLVGEGPLRDELAAQAKALGLERSVIFTGWRNDVPRLLGAADVLALSSLWEAAPLGILEAMAMRRPVIATPVGGVAEFVQHEKTGLLAPPRDVGALAAALLRLLQDKTLREQFGSAGRQRFEASFTLNQMMQQYTEFLEKHVREQLEPVTA